MEYAVDSFLKKLNLSRSHVLYTGGGHFYLIIPNTKASRIALTEFESAVNTGSIINVGVRQTFIRLPYPSFHKKDGHNHTHPIQSKRRNPIERMMNYVQLQLYRKNV